MYQDHGAEGFLPISVVAQDAQGGVPTVDDAVLWRDELGLTFPVLADVDHTFYPVWDPGDLLPVTYLIDRDGVVRWADIGGSGSLPEIVQQVTALLSGG